jgi:hypothetical protein
MIETTTASIVSVVDYSHAPDLSLLLETLNTVHRYTVADLAFLHTQHRNLYPFFLHRWHYKQTTDLAAKAA